MDSLLVESNSSSTLEGGAQSDPRQDKTLVTVEDSMEIMPSAPVTSKAPADTKNVKSLNEEPGSVRTTPGSASQTGSPVGSLSHVFT